MPTRPPRLGARRRDDPPPARAPDLRPQSQHRGYDSTWRALSKQVRMEEPLCRHCLRVDRVCASVLVDHIVPIECAPDLRLDRKNLQALCSSCHARKTRRDHARSWRK